MTGNVFMLHCVREPAPEPPNPPELARLRTHLHDLLVQLERIRTTVTVAAAALRHQNCEIDVDVAAVLQHSAGNPLGAQIERTEALLARLGRYGARG